MAQNSVGANKLALQAHHFEVSKAAAEHHDRYAALLHGVRAKTATARKAVADAASEALSNIYAAIDVPETRSGPRRTDHVIADACELTCNAIASELLFQPGTHLRWRLNGFRREEWDLTPQTPLENFLHRLQGALTYVFRQAAFESMRPEYALWRTEGFVSLMRLIAQDISRLDPNALKKGISESIAAYQAELDAHRQVFQDAHKQLQTAFRHNDLERFQLSEMSPKLNRLISQEAAQLDNIQHLGLPEHESFCKYAVPDLHTWVVYFCLILHLAQTNESWLYLAD